MRKKSQDDLVRRELLENGEVSRNWALKQFISRLGAIIFSINQEEGWKVEGEFRKTPYGKDYVYKLVDCPLKKVVYRKPNGEVVATVWEKAQTEV